VIFRPDHIDLMGKDLKTRTRRLALEGDAIVTSAGPGQPASVWYVSRKGRRLYVRGQEYAIQPGRGHPAVGDFFLEAIRRERLQAMTEAEAVAEGMNPNGAGSYGMRYSPGQRSFFNENWVWEGDPDDPARPVGHVRASALLPLGPLSAFAAVWDEINNRPGIRWYDNPFVYVLTLGDVRVDTGWRTIAYGSVRRSRA
jgi:hypothetical protein